MRGQLQLSVPEACCGAFPSLCPPRTRSSLRIALLWQCLSFCSRTANTMFSHEEECTVPWYSIWKMQNCCVLFLIIRCQGFKTEQFWKALLLQMLLVWDVKPCSAFLHPTWNQLEEADNENVAFLLFSPYYQSSEQPLAERRYIHRGWCIHAGVCDIRVSSCMCKMLEVWIRQQKAWRCTLKDVHIYVHLGAWSIYTFLCASFICVHVYVCVPECSREEFWKSLWV